MPPGKQPKPEFMQIRSTKFMQKKLANIYEQELWKPPYKLLFGGISNPVHDLKPNARIPGEFLVEYESGYLVSAGPNTFGKVYIDPDGLKPIVYDPSREKYFHMDMVDVSNNVRVIGYAPLESAVQLQIELEKLRQVLAIFEEKVAVDNGPPDLPITLSDTEIEDAEREDREFMTCWRCGWLSQDCQCEADDGAD
jgi:hypothetical protein